MIPKIIYFNFGFSPDFGEKPFGLVHHLAIKSAKVVNNCEVLLFYHHVPENNEWWERSKEYCSFIEHPIPHEVHGHKLHHVAFKSDVFRLDLLNKRGGIYLDMDTICIKPLDDLLSHRFVMGKEEANGKVIGLCNAVMLAEPNTEFGKIWWDDYKNYNPDWGVMSVIRPHRIAINHPEHITILSRDAFFKYSWTEEDIKKVHEHTHDMTGAYLLHLWEQCSYDKYLQSLTASRIMHHDTTYNLLARHFL